MANFLYIFRGDESGMGNLSPTQLQEQMQKWSAWIQALTKSGNFKSGEPLEQTGKTIRGNKKTVNDGPYAEAKDLVGGYLLVSAPNLESAVELAKGCPTFEHNGSVEVRPIREMKM
jgi:hypothetical protein